MMASRRARNAGFTLLEVLVAIAILGLGLVAILSAQTGLFASSQRTERLSFAVGLVRCRMTELEMELVRNGFPLIDADESGLCCEDERIEGFECTWKVEKVELPSATDMQTLEGSDESGGADLGPLGALSSIEQTKGAVLGPNADLSSVADLMGGAVAAGSQGMAPLVMGMVYPSLKPMLEASIRRVTVTAKWKEGSIERDLTITQFLTQPQQGGFDPAAGAGITEAAEGLIDSFSGGMGTGTGAGVPPQGGGQ